MSLLLKNYNDDFDFECWKNLSNPDVFQLTFIKNDVNMEHIWQEETMVNI